MAYRLKTTGIAANCTMCLAVDPDGGVLKDFASSAVTADMTIGGSATYGITTWDGNTRDYIQTAASTDIAFGTTKPNVSVNSTTNTASTIVAVTEVGSNLNGVIFGPSDTSYFAHRSLASGGSTHPAITGFANARNGTQSIAAGQKLIFGFRFRWTGTTYEGDFFTALHDAASMTTGALSSLGASGINWNLSYLCRAASTSANYHNGKLFGVFAFDVELTEAQWDSLRDDWRGTLLEVDPGSSATITLSPDPAAATTADATKTITITRSAASSGTTTYNLTSGTPATATVPAMATITDGNTTGTFDATIVAAGTTTITATNAANSGETDSVVLTVSATKKLKLLAHADAQGDSGVAGVVFEAPTGSNITGPNKIGEFTGKSFEASLEGGKAVLKVPVSDFGGGSLTTTDTPVALVRNATNTTGIISCTVIEE